MRRWKWIAAVGCIVLLSMIGCSSGPREPVTTTTTLREPFPYRRSAGQGEGEVRGRLLLVH